MMTGKQQHTCNMCGSVSVWTDNHCWYGSWLSLDDERHPPTIICSKDCYQLFQASTQKQNNEWLEGKPAWVEEQT